MAHPIYYKATRATDPAVDLHTGQVVYRVGKTARPLPHDGTPSICGPGYLHASDTPSETLVGGTWPCRLFEVTGKVHAGFDSYHAHKGGFKQLRVVREIDPYLALGPNGRYVAGIIERTRKVTYDEATQIRTAWGAARDAAWGAAWDAALATLTRDMITPAQFDKLTEPWRKVFGDDFDALLALAPEWSSSDPIDFDRGRA